MYYLGTYHSMNAQKKRVYRCFRRICNVALHFTGYYPTLDTYKHDHDTYIPVQALKYNILLMQGGRVICGEKEM